MQKNRNKWQYVFLFGYALIVMLLCAGSSPLIEYLSPDSSIFYVMGRAAANGSVLYRDIIDHKGYYLFLFNQIGAMLTPDAMNGLFFVEILFAFIKLACLFKIGMLYLHNGKKAFLAAALFLAVSTNFLSWNTGNLTEQFALAFYLISAYDFVRYLEKSRLSGRIEEHPPRSMLIHGLCSGIVLFIQANLVGMWIPFGIVLAAVLLRNGHIKNFLDNLVMLLSGVGIAFLPVLLYGIWNDCIDEMYYGMFGINFTYSAAGRGDKSVFAYLKEFLFCPSGVIVILAAVGAYLFCRFYRSAWMRICMWGGLLASIVCMSVSLNANPIYYTTYMPFIFPLLIGVVKFVKEKWFLLGCMAVLSMTVVCNLQLIKKVFRIGSSSYVYESAYLMEEKMTDKESKVLVLGEALFYHCTNSIPHLKYFTIFADGMTYDVFPYCYDEQYKSLLSGENKYVIVQSKDAQDLRFWPMAEWDEAMAKVLEEEYEVLLEYREGGVYSLLYGRQ